MTVVDRRRFLAALLGMPLLARVRTRSVRLELQYVAAFAAPYLEERLVQETPLDVERRGGISYAVFAGDVIGILPVAAEDASSVIIAAASRDRDGRLGVTVDVTRARFRPARTRAGN